MDARASSTGGSAGAGASVLPAPATASTPSVNSGRSKKSFFSHFSKGSSWQGTDGGEDLGAHLSVHVPELRLWTAASKGQVKEVKALIEEGADVSWELPENHPLAIVYKSRRVRSQPLHAAAVFNGSGPCPQDGWPEARECVDCLLQARADAAAMASTKPEDGQRMFQAIHFAAGAGNSDVIKSLVRHGADPNAFVLTGDPSARLGHGRPMDFYMPIHDAVWFNRANCVDCLLEKKADFAGKNIEGKNALHLAAELGHADLAQKLLDQDKQRGTSRELMAARDNHDKIPFDLALEKGRFPLNLLGVFTINQEPRDMAESFIKVAQYCPAAAQTLLRWRDRGPRSQDPDAPWSSKRSSGLRPSTSLTRATYRTLSSQGSAGQDDDAGEVLASREWRCALQYAAKNKLITFRELALLIRRAPKAAMDLLDILTVTPEVKDEQHNPLPIRAKLPRGKPCAMSFTYELEDDWRWCPRKQGVPWQKKFAKPTPRGHEVSIRVLKLPGVVGVEVLSALAETKDLRLFTKLPVQALLKVTWFRLRYFFVARFVHEILATSVISIWIWGSRDEFSDTARRLLWMTIASQGVVNVTVEALAALRRCLILGGHDGRVAFLRRSLRGYWLHASVRLAVDASTVWLAQSSSIMHWPGSSSEDSGLLALNSLLHWVHLLYQLRAFQWSGQRLLPIMRSVMPIAGMLVIMLFLLSSFLNAYRAMDRSGDNDIRIYEVVFFFLTGNPFLETSDVAAMDPQSRVMIMIIQVLACFAFMIVAMNVFIAVLSDCYAQEQERMVCTFLKERASICFNLFLWPSWDSFQAEPVQDDELEEQGRPSQSRRLGAGLTAVVALGLIGGSVGSLGLSSNDSWPGAYMLSVGLLLAQIQLRDLLTFGWKDRHIWLCHEVGVDESAFLPLGEDESSPQTEETSGRFMVLQRCIRNQAADLHDQGTDLQKGLGYCQRAVGDCQRAVDECQRAVGHCQKGFDDRYEELDGKLTGIDAKLEGATDQVRELAKAVATLMNAVDELKPRSRCGPSKCPRGCGFNVVGQREVQSRAKSEEPLKLRSASMLDSLGLAVAPAKRAPSLQQPAEVLQQWQQQPLPEQQLQKQQDQPEEQDQQPRQQQQKVAKKWRSVRRLPACPCDGDDDEQPAAI